MIDRDFTEVIKQRGPPQDFRMAKSGQKKRYTTTKSKINKKKADNKASPIDSV